MPRSVLFCQVKIQTSWEVTDYAPFQCTNHSWNVYKWTHYKAQLWFFYQIAYTASSGLDGFGLASFFVFLAFYHQGRINTFEVLPDWKSQAVILFYIGRRPSLVLVLKISWEQHVQNETALFKNTRIWMQKPQLTFSIWFSVRILCSINKNISKS